MYLETGEFILICLVMFILGAFSLACHVWSRRDADYEVLSRHCDRLEAIISAEPIHQPGRSRLDVTV